MVLSVTNGATQSRPEVQSQKEPHNFFLSIVLSIKAESSYFTNEKVHFGDSLELCDAYRRISTKIKHSSIYWFYMQQIQNE